MSLHDRIRALVDAADPNGTVTVKWLADLLRDESDTTPTPAADASQSCVDLTVREVADLFNRGESTVRTWIANKEFPNAYRFRGREWRIPRSDVADMQQRDAQHHRAGESVVSEDTAEFDNPDLSSWRSHVKGRS